MKTTMKKLVCMMLVVLLLVGMTACGSSNSGNASTATEARTDIIIGVAAEPGNLDPNESLGASINENMAYCLTTLGEDMIPKGEIAKDWTVSDDGLEYVFEINTDVRFANGDYVTIEDVEFSLNRSWAIVSNTQYFDCLAAVEVVDDTHIKCTLSYPCGLFPTYMADSSTCIVSKKVVEAAGDDYGINPAGSTAGPYDFVSWTPGVSVKLTANPYYYGGELAIKDIEFRFITEASTGAISVEAGDIDVYENPNYIDVMNLKDNDKISVFEQPICGFDFLGFNTANAPYDNMLVRQAIAYSFDREELIMAVYGEGAAEAADGFFADFVFGHSDNIMTYERDPEKAKQLLAEAGYENGLEISIITMDGSRSKVAEYLQDTMKESGITVKIEMAEWSKFVDDLINGNLGAFIIGVSGDVPDADGTLYPQFRSDGGQNVHTYSNADVDEKLLQARQSTDPAERLKLYEEVQNILMEELPCIPLYFTTSFSLYNSNLQNFTSNFASDVLVEYMSWKAE